MSDFMNMQAVPPLPPGAKSWWRHWWSTQSMGLGIGLTRPTGTGRYSDSRCSDNRCSDNHYSNNHCSDNCIKATSNPTIEREGMEEQWTTCKLVDMGLKPANYVAGQIIIINKKK